MPTPFDSYMSKMAINTALAGRMSEAGKALKKQDVFSGWRYNKMPMGSSPEAFQQSPHFNKQLYGYNGSGGAGSPNNTLAVGTIRRLLRQSGGVVPDTAKLDRFKAMAASRETGRRDAFLSAHDKTMMSGRHAGSRDITQAPAENFKTENHASGAGIDPDLAYKGTPMKGMVEERKKPASEPMWITGSPSIAHGYAPGTATKDPDHISHFMRTFNTHPAEGHGPGNLAAASPWTPHIAVTPADFVARNGRGVPAQAVHAAVNKEGWKHGGSADRGFSPIYERVIDKQTMDASEISRMKSLPSGKGYQQVKGKFTQQNHPMNFDFKNTANSRDVAGANDMDARRAVSSAAIAAAAPARPYDPRA